MSTSESSWDVFISYAREDKAAVAKPLAEVLLRAGLRVWIDEHEISLGDSLTKKINEGLARSRYGIVILSPDFLAKEWPKRELAALLEADNDAPAVTLDHEDIPGLMKGMKMEFSVADAKVLEGIKAGDEVKGRVKKGPSGYVVTHLERR